MDAQRLIEADRFDPSRRLTIVPVLNYVADVCSISLAEEIVHCGSGATSSTVFASGNCSNRVRHSPT
jgi:hypothetical protein